MSSSNAYARTSEAARNVTESSQEFVGDHAVPTTLAAFGIGVGVGLALVSLMADSSRQEAGVAHKLGRQVLDAMSSAVPDSLAHLGR